MNRWPNDLPEICPDCLNTGIHILNPNWPKGGSPHHERCACNARGPAWPDEVCLKHHDGTYIWVTAGAMRTVSGLNVRAIRYEDGTCSWVADARLLSGAQRICPQCHKDGLMAPDDYLCHRCRKVQTESSTLQS